MLCIQEPNSAAHSNNSCQKIFMYNTTFYNLLNLIIIEFFSLFNIKEFTIKIRMVKMHFDVGYDLGFPPLIVNITHK